MWNKREERKEAERKAGLVERGFGVRDEGTGVENGRGFNEKGKERGMDMGMKRDGAEGTVGGSGVAAT